MHPRGRWIRLSMCTMTGLVMFDESGVAVALTEVRESFDLSASQANWVVSAYLVSLSATVAAFGRIADLVGLKKVLIGGALAFGATSVAAGLAPSYEWLVAARVLQGLAAAAAFPSSAGILRAATPPDQLGRALGQLGLATAIGLASGPFLGGLLAEWISWRAVFFVGVPVVISVVAVAAAQLESLEEQAPRGGRFDVAGLALLVVSLAATVVALMEGPGWGWTSRSSLALFGLGLCTGVAFLVVESRRADPLIEFGLFREADFAAGNLMTFLAQFSKTAVIIYAPLYMIDVLGLTTFQAGLGLVPGILAAMPFGPLGGRLADRYGERRPLLVALLALAGALAYTSAVIQVDRYAWLVPGLLIWGAANTTVFVCSRRAVHGAVPPTTAGQASGVNATAQWLGAALSVPILGVFVASAPENFSRLYISAAVVVVAAALVAVARFQRPSAGRA